MVQTHKLRDTLQKVFPSCDYGRHERPFVKSPLFSSTYRSVRVSLTDRIFSLEAVHSHSFTSRSLYLGKELIRVRQSELERSDGVFSAFYSNSQATADGWVDNHSHLALALALVNAPRSREEAPAQDNTAQRSCAIPHLTACCRELLNCCPAHFPLSGLSTEPQLLAEYIVIRNKESISQLSQCPK